MGLRGTRCETSHHLPKCGGISVPLLLMRTLSRPTTHHSTDRCCVRVAGPIGCDYPNNRLSAPYRWRVPSLASTRQSSRMSADTCESRFPTTKPAPMRRRAHELSWLRWIAAGSLSDDLLRVVRGEGRFSQPAQPGIRRHRQNNVSETGGIPHVHRFDNNDSSQQRQLPRHQTVPGLFRHPRKSVDGIFRSNTVGFHRDKARNNTKCDSRGGAVGRCGADVTDEGREAMRPPAPKGRAACRRNNDSLPGSRGTGHRRR